jgi:hypothetical protein
VHVLHVTDYDASYVWLCPATEEEACCFACVRTSLLVVTDLFISPRARMHFAYFIWLKFVSHMRHMSTLYDMIQKVVTIMTVVWMEHSKIERRGHI